MFVAIRLKRLPALLLALALVLLSLLYLRSGGKTGGGTAEALSKYDRAVMIIDPGHGGEDGGAQTAEGLLESKINLDISLRLDALAGLYRGDCVSGGGEHHGQAESGRSAGEACPDQFIPGSPADQHTSKLLPGSPSLRLSGTLCGNRRKRGLCKAGPRTAVPIPVSR